MTVVPRQSALDDADEGSFVRVPPQDIPAEQSVLGSMASWDQAAIDCQDILKPEDYYRPAHATIHQAIVDLRAKGEPCDPVQLGAYLRRQGDLERIGGAPYLHTLVQAVDSPANGSYHAEIVREKAILRRLTEAGMKITQSGYAGEGEIDDLVAAAAAEIATVVEGTGKDDDFLLPRDTMEGTLDKVDAAKNSTGITGLATGFSDLDRVTSGLQPGQMIVVAGRPGMGKSTLALDMARHCAVKQNVPAAFISLEMSVDELNMRLLSAEAKVALHHLRSGHTTDEDWVRMARYLPQITEAPLYITESANTLGAIQAKCRRLKSRVPDLGMIVIDYLQLVTVGGRQESREREVSTISRSLKLLAKELQLPVVALAQLNRGPEMRTDKRPSKSDLRESGSLEQDADMVLLVYREDAYEPESGRAGEVDLILDKHRNGPTCTITVGNQLHYSRFVDLAAT
ncbi:replicative DNA helicase [Streptomyces anulatus]|uniref:replicative DNA helicase n=1 Tax=Streptomyces anulatus TaxID=1892 RepID=UPI0022557FC1|nr:replicative DNA helicase [Streptomyces anulatus]MCX4489816.1 replicative DNA helicase [Streptomyces anulatus]MCX4489859.1 replicative DNA helicase [Streptomyces anulatus]